MNNNKITKDNCNLVSDRISWIDMAKGYGILFVIFAHLGVGSIGTWIYTFHMPLFFFLSGYVFDTKYTFDVFIKKKIRSIIVPYFCLGIPMVFFQILLDWHRGIRDVEHMILLLKRFLVQNRLWTLWYIACLFCLNVEFYILVKSIKNIIALAIISFYLLLVGLTYYHVGGSSLPWNLDVCMTATVFYFAGYVLKLNYKKIREFLTMKKSIGLFIVMIIINVACGYEGIKIAGNGMEMYHCTYGFPPLTFLSAFSGILAVVIFSHWFILNGVRYVGINSMIYYAWHQTIMIPVVRYILTRFHINTNYARISLGMVCERNVELIMILLFLTMCNIFIKKLHLDFVLGKKRMKI